MTAPLVLTGLSVLSPLGHDVHQTCAAIRAGIHGLSQHPFFFPEMPDPEWDEPEPLLVGLVPGVHTNFVGARRVLELALHALRALTRDTKLMRAELGSTALLLSLPEVDDVVGTWDLGPGFADELAKRAGLPAFSPTFVDRSGHVSMLRMLAQAQQLLEARTCERCILLGVESYHDEARLAGLDQKYKLRTDRARDGFLPGEAAVGMLVERGASPSRAPIVSLGAPSFAVEPRTIRGELSSSGNGLCSAIETALATGGATKSRWVFCDLNGESYRSYEWGLARTRLAERCFASAVRLQHPADCIGDVGVVSAGLSIACAAQAFVRGYAPAENALVWASAEEGMRAAVLVGSFASARPS